MLGIARMPHRGGACTDTKGGIDDDDDDDDDDDSARSLRNIVGMRTSGMKIKEDNNIDY